LGNHLWLVRLWPVDVVKFVEDRTTGALLTDLLSLARYGGSSFEVLGRFLAEEGRAKLDEELGMQFDGVDEVLS
jgi:pyruvate carboxylase